MMTTTIPPLTVDRANADAWHALRDVHIEPLSVVSTDMGYCYWLGGNVIETAAHVVWYRKDDARNALLALYGAKGCEYHGGCATIYRRVRP